MSEKTSDRNRIRSLVKDLREATIPKEGESPVAVNHVWDWLFQLVEVKKEEE